MIVEMIDVVAMEVEVSFCILGEGLGVPAVDMYKGMEGAERRRRSCRRTTARKNHKRRRWKER